MPLGTLDRTPPPFFKQGIPALTKLVFFSAFALFLMVADTRFTVTGPLRAALATALHPVERTLLAPLRGWTAMDDYLSGVASARARETEALQRLALQSERAARVDQQAEENARLRGLLGLRPQITVRSVAAEVLYEAADPYTRKLVIDRGTTQGVVPAAPVIDATGVIGQVTRVYPLAAEVTLLIDRDGTIPVLNTRTQGRAVAYGDPATAGSGGGMELRFLANNTDIEPDDLLHTSGVDGVYPPGLPVARVLSVDRRTGSFAKVLLKPTASLDNLRHVLVLEPLALQLPPRPDEAASAPAGRPAR